MADYAIPKNGAAYVFFTGLVTRADTRLLKSVPTLAAGDFKVSIDGGALANLATLPTNTPGGVMIKLSLSAAEMTGDNITVVMIDAAGDEWCDQIVNIQTTARGMADLAYPATTGRSMVVDAAGLVDANMVKAGPTGAGTALTARDIGASVLLSAGTGTGQLDFTSGIVKSNATQILGTAVSTPATAGILDVNVKNIDNDAASASGTVTFPNSTLASTTNITAGTIATVTNQLTAAAIATGVWQDATAGDFTTASSIGKSLYTSGVVPGGTGGIFIAGTNAATIVTTSFTTTFTGNLTGSVASVTGLTASDVGAIKAKTDFLPSATAGTSTGLLISGTNSGTTTLAALTITGTTTHTGDTVHTGNVTMAAGLAITQSTLNGDAFSVTGNGTGRGIYAKGGTTGRGVMFDGGATSGSGLDITSAGGSTAMRVYANGTGWGLLVGALGKDGVRIEAGGHGIEIEAGGASKHGIFVTGGTSGVSDGIKVVAGSGGVDIRGRITGNITGVIDSCSTCDIVGTLGDTAKAQVNTEVLDVLNTDLFDEPGQETPGVNVSLAAKIGMIYKAWRNKSTQTSTAYKLYNDNTTQVDQKATVSDDGTVFTREEMTSGP